MSERLFGLYEQELAYIREEVREFSGRFSKVASRLRLSAESLEDPHVSRLIDSFALLTARLRLKLEDEFPEVCQSLLQCLYPQYTAPVPSAAVANLELTAAGAELVEGYVVPRGTVLETEEINGQACFYRTCFSTRLWPWKVTKSEYFRPPFPFPNESSLAPSTTAAIRVDMAKLSDKLEWEKTPVDSLRFFLGGSTACGNRLYEAIIRDCVGVGLYSSRRPSGRFVPRQAVRPVGFDNDQGLLEHDNRTQAAYRLIWDFFALPEKYRFVDVDLSSVWKDAVGDGLYMVFFLSGSHPELQSNMSRDAISLGSTPAVNLFEQPAEPIQMTESQVEYRVVPNYRSPLGMEVHTVLDVSASRPGGDEDSLFRPFFRPSHRIDRREADRYWHMTRRRRMADGEESDRGTEVYLTIVDLNNRPRPSEDWTLHVDTLCCNRDLPKHLTTHTPLTPHGGPITARFLTEPTRTRRPVDRDSWIWQLISHLSINHLAISSDSGGELLREMLRLYNSHDADEIHNAIAGLLSVSYSRGTAKITEPGRGSAVCRGVDIQLVVDDERLEAVGGYLFLSVLDRFLAMLAGVNSFTRVRARTAGGNSRYYAGPARSGQRVLL